MTHATNIIETEGLTKRFGDRVVVSGLDLRVPRGTAFGFLGHNGAGKTTLMRMLLGLTAPSAGWMWIDGHRLPAERAVALARVGAIVEEPHFHSHLTGRENLRIVAAVRGAEAQTRIEPALARVGLSERAGERVKTYSQGMRQRLGVARCLLIDPQLLMLDEPMNGLDPAGILEFRGMVRELVAEGRTVFLSSHLLDEIEKTCDAAAIIDQGRLIAQGPLEALLASETADVEIGCRPPDRAFELLRRHPAVASTSAIPGGVRIRLSRRDGVASINAELVGAGIAVFRLEAVHETLEQRFLQITTRIGGQP
ncbi:MAG: ABC transporter ATP-binding protein [Solirubrobacterales bacterium]|nr:ABC transporter ATP-binding protein [Solirubrobacterales bacterium]MBV9715758.1 ABC transporter ATP-binding protein [Solirubrobacterales bacterium]